MRRRKKRILEFGWQWHDLRMMKEIAVLLTACLFAFPAAADPTSVTGQVVAEDGTPIAAVFLTLDGEFVDVAASGQFELKIERDASKTHHIELSADGFYSTVQTLHDSDFVADGVISRVELVRKQADRKLLLFAGDAMLSRRYFKPRSGEQVLVREGYLAEDSRKLLQPLKPYIELADYASVNLETQLSAEDLTDRLPKSVTFFSPPELAEALQWAGFDYVALGNNHMFDYQSEGLDSTFAALDDLGLDYSGGGANDAEARKPAVVNIGDDRHVFLSYVGWAGTFTPSQVAETAKGGAALGNSAVIAEDLELVAAHTTAVVQLHAGLEYSARPAMSEQTTLRQAVRSGADVVIGHHAHVLQGFEIVDGRLIAYSMGNFLFDQYHYTTQMGMLLYVWMDGDRLHRAEAVPLHINGYIPTPATGAFRNSVLHRLAKLSDPQSVCMRPNGLHAIVESCVPEDVADAEVVRMTSDRSSALPVAVRELGVSPLAKTTIEGAEQPYRMGVDILRRGDFEYVGLFGSKDRTWIENAEVRVATGDNKRLLAEIEPGQKSVRTGQKVFERVFTSSNPATVSGRIQADSDVRLRVLLQRRRTTDTLEDAVADGPLTEIGSQVISSQGWGEFSFDYNQPRVSTRSVRLIFELEALTDDGASVELDDLSWIEWHTPWIGPQDNALPTFATHLQFQK